MVELEQWSGEPDRGTRVRWARLPRADLSAWAELLSQRLGRSSDEIAATGLWAQDFPAELPAVEISFPDGSTARFLSSFFVVDEGAGRVAIFTEHCGYWDLCSHGIQLKCGAEEYSGPDH